MGMKVIMERITKNAGRGGKGKRVVKTPLAASPEETAQEVADAYAKHATNANAEYVAEDLPIINDAEEFEQQIAEEQRQKQLEEDRKEVRKMTVAGRQRFFAPERLQELGFNADGTEPKPESSDNGSEEASDDGDGDGDGENAGAETEEEPAAATA